MSNTAYIGSGTTLSSKYYLRSFYRSNREAGLPPNAVNSVATSSLSQTAGRFVRQYAG